MQIRKFLLIGAVLLFSLFKSFAQTAFISITGKITDDSGEILPGALIKILGTNISSTSDGNGLYILKNVPPSGKQAIQVSSVGMKSQTKELAIKGTQNLNVNFNLTPNVQQMETVSVIGRSHVQETNRQAYNVTAIDAKKLYNSTLDISGALDRVAGVRVRESGGVGSNFNLSLNGFSGDHIKYFIDGIPMDNFGSSFQINNIPINLADRVEVYKGVVPVWLGSDALGGAINIITADHYRNFIDVSYSYGSFNTHRSVINAGIISKKGFTFQINAFQNYSDNNYKVTLQPSNIYTGAFEQLATLKRFHDTYHNETLITNIGVVNKKYADKLLFGLTLGENYKEIQTGARMQTVFGGWHRRGNILMPSLKYKKENLIKGLDITLNANYNLGYEKNIDTMNVRFDWYGNMKAHGSSGESSRSLYKYKNNNGLATAMANYKINDKQSLALSNSFNTFNRKGNDLLNPANDLNEPIKKTHKNILGLGYSYALDNQYSINVFGKYLSQIVINGNSNNKGNTERFGYGTAITYFINPELQLKASYELTNKMPEAFEIFGDMESVEGNPGLKPESSNNINVGFIYGFDINKTNRFSVTANGIYRNATDYIYRRLNNNQSKLVADNRDGVRTFGGDAEVRYSYKEWLSTGLSATYQFIQNMQKREPGYTIVSPLYKDQMPNIPYLFGNADVSFSLHNIGKQGNHLNIGYNLLYVHAFWLYWPSMGETSATAEKKQIPKQLSNDVNLVYSMLNGRYNIGLEARNITDALLYDNFSLQKPSRGFYLNFRYFINKQQ
ncbi:TonB-dependent receptor plug [Pseudopedobacter saltans DSM 12145]|uniref:TonB-dependent receptor plug n=1 Tax=Pseudopedobacter saltans (strain ATCC 51119 / DSM 12145 / JCM 21818 / CCUG 39354 / LMG 10337 / NBRC 100064 / NCIMB 13643) TaxID=762903 RepID=F0SDD0_PSESL|nr:TonB-dependent receptor [Pseudopedobacter saltans]ADY53913.1 TonB-dependent receptor plug [Pseudopedobacter saltans DSM 12145]